MPTMVGARVIRKEDPNLITGRGNYVDDVRLTGTAYMGFVRSSEAHAEIVSIDTSAASPSSRGNVIAAAIVRPNAEIAQGFDGTELKTKDGLTIQGILIKQGDPLMMRSMGSVTQIIPADRIATRRRMKESLMMNAAQLGLTAQDVADLVAFLQRSN